MKALFSKSKAMISIAVVLCMVIALLPTGIFTLIGAAGDTNAWDSRYELPTNYGEKNAGKSDNPYKIGNLNQLMLLSHVSNQTDSSVTVSVGEGSTVEFTKGDYGWFAGNHFVLTENIDLSGVEWTPLGGGANAIAFGSFDGQGHTISGMKVDTNGTSAGFIGQLSSNGSPQIKNLHVSGSVKGGAYTSNVGGLVGRMTVAHGTGTIENCSFTGTVVDARADVSYVGGLVGQAERSGTTGEFKVANCRFDGNVTGDGKDPTGGLIGHLNSVKSNLPSVSVSSTFYINGCYTTGGEVKTGDAGVGGIVGQSGARITVNIENCWSDMMVTGTIGTGKKVSGLVGYLNSPNGFLNISNSHFAGKVASQVFVNNIVSSTDLLQNNNIKLKNVYYKAGCYTTTDAAGGALTNEAKEQSALAFADGTVAKALGVAKWATSATKKIPVLSDIGAATADAMVTLGTQMRTYTTTGMRFKFKMDTAAQADALKLKEYGVVLAKGTKDAASSLLWDNANAKRVAVYEQGGEEILYKANVKDDGKIYDEFTVVLNITSVSKYETAYDARAYALYEDGNGQEIVVYSATIDGASDDYPNTLYDAASIALLDPDIYNTDELAYLDRIVNYKNTNNG